MYMSPEMLREQRTSTAADMWSLGCVLYELMELRPAVSLHIHIDFLYIIALEISYIQFDCEGNLFEMSKRIIAGKIPEISCQVSLQVKEILTSLLNIDYR